MKGVESIDEQLEAVCERRELLLDLVVRSLVELDSLAIRQDQLLDQRATA